MHWYPQEWVALVEKEGAANGAKIGKNPRGFVTFDVPTQSGMFFVFQPQQIELEIRLKAMDAAGVDMHALSLTSPLVYWAPPNLGLRLPVVYGAAAAAAYKKYPTLD